MPVPAKRALQCLLMFVVMFAVAFVTRMPAIHMVAISYGMHGLLAAPFYAIAVALFVRLTGVVWPAAVGGALVALVLGMMSPVMMVGNGVPAAAVLAACAVERLRTREDAAVVFGTLWGALAFPATLLGGLALGSYSMSGEGVLVNVLLAVLGAALAYAGTMLVKVLVKR